MPHVSLSEVADGAKGVDSILSSPNLQQCGGSRSGLVNQFVTSTLLVDGVFIRGLLIGSHLSDVLVRRTSFHSSLKMSFRQTTSTIDGEFWRGPCVLRMSSFA